MRQNKELVSSYIRDDHNPAICIICQKNKKGVKANSTPNGRSKVIDAANVRKDNVLNGLSITECLLFFYNVTNERYKRYTLSKTLEQIQVLNKVEDYTMEVDQTDKTPPPKTKRWELSDFFENVCLYLEKEKKKCKAIDIA